MKKKHVLVQKKLIVKLSHWRPGQALIAPGS
jgi:hypothetical protein